MTDRDRLAVKICNATQKTNFACKEAKCVGKGICAHCYVMADNLLLNGVIAPPCKVGDIVYAKYSGTNEIEYYVIDEVTHLGSDCFQLEAHLENEDGYTVDIIEFGVPEIGLTVFLTKEEAEEKLKEREGK